MLAGTGLHPVSRCSKCAMPNTVPGARFSPSGECWWCQTQFPDVSTLGPDALRERLASLRDAEAPADVMVAVSGGTDSSYMLTELVSTYGLRVEACTYVQHWAEESIAQRAVALCDRLHVRHHIIGGGPPPHEAYRSFFRAWLQRPGIVGANLACVACKSLTALPQQLAARRGIRALVWGTSPYEVPPFIALEWGRGESLPLWRSAAKFIASLRASRPLCLSVVRHLPTVLHGCLSLVARSRTVPGITAPGVQTIHFYEHHPWDPPEMRETVARAMSGSQGGGDPPGWRRDCRFVPIKEYMFQTMLGADYTTAYISNQVRHGLMTRDQGLRRLAEHHAAMPRAVEQAIEATGLGDVLERLDLSCWDGPALR